MMSFISFEQWVEAAIVRYEADARALYAQVCDTVPELRALATTSQTPPYHAEGPFVLDGVIRALCGLLAIQDGASFSGIPALQGIDVAMRDALDALVRSHASVLTVFLLVHDLGKAETLTFDAPRGSKGEREGFAACSVPVSAADRQLYDKLRRAFCSSYSGTEEEAFVAFYDRYQIRAHYPDHARHFALGDAAFERLSTHFFLSPRSMELVRFMTRFHMDALFAFADGSDLDLYEVLLARAHKWGFDAHEALDLLAVGAFFDACVGSLVYEDGTFIHSANLLIHYARAETLFASERLVARRAAIERAHMGNVRDVMRSVGLDGDSLFALVTMPFGPERGELSAAVLEAVVNPDISLSGFDSEVAERIVRARTFLTPSGSHETIFS